MRLLDLIFPGLAGPNESVEFVCPNCKVYEREERSDGRNNYTVCARCGLSTLQLVPVDFAHGSMRKTVPLP